jgi:hypothetical protein
VSCEPRISYQFEDGKTYECLPDIVVWDDIADPDQPPDLEPHTNWPILWACEIKYGYKEPSDWDLKKLRYLVAQGTMQHGCWLKMSRTRAVSGDPRQLLLPVSDNYFCRFGPS